ncbi:MAG: hypothetical protein Q4C71_04835 [Microbacteriaceae bacterium]|nr:hypothetical protein [Microbacteriaceae bacterium]
MDNTVFYQINPFVTPAWQTPTQLRFGFDAARAVVDIPTKAEEAVISTLLLGASIETLRKTAKRAGISDPAKLDTILHKLSPVILTRPANSEITPQPTWPLPRFKVIPPLLSGDHGTQLAAQITQMLVASGTPTQAADMPTSKSRARAKSKPAAQAAMPVASSVPEVHVSLNRFLITQTRSEVAARAEITQLPVVFSDDEIKIGPAISADGFPCARCIEIAGVLADPAKPTLAAQLMSYSPITENAQSLVAILPVILNYLTSIHYDLTTQSQLKPGEKPTLRAPIRAKIKAVRGVLLAPTFEEVKLDPSCLCHRAITQTSNTMHLAAAPETAETCRESASETAPLAQESAEPPQRHGIRVLNEDTYAAELNLPPAEAADYNTYEANLLADRELLAVSGTSSAN